MAEKYYRKIKAVANNGTTNVSWRATVAKRIHAFQFTGTYAGGTNSLAGFVTAMTQIIVKVGSVEKWNLSGTQLRDWLLLFGTTFDFNGSAPNTTGCIVTLPLAPEWFLANVNDSLAWNPKLLGGEISVEITFANATTLTVFEVASDDLDAPSSGIITLESITSVAGGTDFFTGTELEPRGRLISASIYPDSTNSNEITPGGLYLGKNDYPAHEDLTSASNDETLERKGLTPAASGRTANIYDIVAVKDDMLSRGWNLAEWGSAKIRIQAAAAMAGTVKTLVARLENR